MEDQQQQQHQQEGSSQAAFTGTHSLDDFIKRITTTVRVCQKSCAELQGWHHYRDYVGVHRTMERLNDTVTKLMKKMFEHQDIELDLSRHNLSDQMDMLREGNDALLERINSEIDEASGLKKNANAEVLDPVIKKVQAPSPMNVGGKNVNVVLLASKNVQKPQLFFSEKVQNSPKEPFIPIIKEKPNSLKPLSIMLCLNPYGQEYYSHPYEYELQHWSPSPLQLTPVTPVHPKPMSETSLTMVSSEHQLAALVNKLKRCSEFAVDLEHHNFRSYLGLTCLIQISTREEDFIVDPLALRGKLTILNEAFTDPKITKVIHGSDFDILWLQRDCGVYVVNLFDTHQAAVILEYPRRSLAALLLRFCDIQANKVFQRADWRIRPLTQELIEYARQDSHFLLYVYDLMRNELIEKGNQLNNLITAVYQRSVDICLKRYDKPVVNAESHMSLYRHSRKTFNARQMFALRALFLWRDKIAREQDESPEYVLPKHMLLQIAEVLPKEMQGILVCCNPIPPLVKTELLTMHNIIREAREQPVIDIKGAQILAPMPDQTSEAESLGRNLDCKHDLSQCEENATHLPTLLNPQETLLGNLFSEAPNSTASLKDKSDMFGKQLKPKRVGTKGMAEVERAMESKFMSPYERYTAYLEFKPLLEGKRRKKDVDLDRMTRVRSHFLSLTNNLPKVPEAEVGRVATNHLQERTAQASVSGLAMEQGKGEEVQEVVVVKEEPAEGKRREGDINLDWITRVRAHFLSLTKNTPKVPEAEVGRVARNHLQERTAQASVSGLAMEQGEGEVVVVKEEPVEVEERRNTDQGERVEDEDGDVVEVIQQEEEKEGEDACREIVQKTTKKKKKKNTSQNKHMVLEEKIKGKKAKKKSLKRKSVEDGAVPRKLQKTHQDNEMEGEEGSNHGRREENNGREVGYQEQPKEEDEGEDEVIEVFDYEKADYSLFQKSKEKVQKKQKIKEMFKGKNQRSKKGKSSMKTFTWGAQNKQW